MTEENLDAHEQLNLSREEAEKIRAKQMEFAETISLVAKREEYRSKQLKLIVISLALAVVSVATSFVASQFVGLGKGKPLESIFSFGASKEMFASKSDVESIKAANELIKDALKRAVERTAVGAENGSSNILEFSVVSAKVAELESRLAVLEKSISDTPEKALSVPMLRKDQDNLSKTFEANRVAVAAEIARVNDLQKWILGGIGAVLVAVIAGLFTSLFTVISKGRSER